MSLIPACYGDYGDCIKCRACPSAEMCANSRLAELDDTIARATAEGQTVDDIELGQAVEKGNRLKALLEKVRK